MIRNFATGSLLTISIAAAGLIALGAGMPGTAVAVLVMIASVLGVPVFRRQIAVAQARAFTRTATPMMARRAGAEVRSGVATGFFLSATGLILIASAGRPGSAALIAISIAALLLAVTVWRDRTLPTISLGAQTASHGRDIRRLFRIATDPAAQVELTAGSLASQVLLAHDEASAWVITARRGQAWRTAAICAASGCLQTAAIVILSVALPSERLPFLGAAGMVIVYTRRYQLLRTFDLL